MGVLIHLPPEDMFEQMTGAGRCAPITRKASGTRARESKNPLQKPLVLLPNAVGRFTGMAPQGHAEAPRTAWD